MDHTNQHKNIKRVLKAHNLVMKSSYSSKYNLKWTPYFHKKRWHLIKQYAIKNTVPDETNPKYKIHL